MPRYGELIGALRGADPMPEDMFDQLDGAYADDIAEVADGAAAKVAQLEAERDQLAAEKVKLQARNYELLDVAPAPDARTPEEGDGPDDTNEDDLDQPADDFFTEDEDEN